MFLIGGKDPIWRGALFRSALAGAESEPPVLSPPVRVSTPGVSGTLQVGQTLTVNPAPIYSGHPSPAVSTRWQMRPNGGGTIVTLDVSQSLALTETHLGMQIRTQDMATNSQGSTGWATNPWLGPVEPAAAAGKYDSSAWDDGEAWNDEMTWSG